MVHEHNMQAESAFSQLSKTGPVSLVNVHKEHKGYTGQGYLQFGSSSDESVEWKLVGLIEGTRASEKSRNPISVHVRLYLMGLYTVTVLRTRY